MTWIDFEFNGWNAKDWAASYTEEEKGEGCLPWPFSSSFTLAPLALKRPSRGGGKGRRMEGPAQNSKIQFKLNLPPNVS
jgi:hypothetical protein